VFVCQALPTDLAVFENFCNSEKSSFSKDFMAFRIFCYEVLRPFANWQIWAKKKQYVLCTALNALF